MIDSCGKPCQGGYTENVRYWASASQEGQEQAAQYRLQRRLQRVEKLNPKARRKITQFDAILTRSNTSRELSLTEIQTLAAVLAPPPLAQPVCRDADDDAVLALVLAAQVDFIVSGDDDLLSLQAFQHIPILTPAEALLRIEAEK